MVLLSYKIPHFPFYFFSFCFPTYKEILSKKLLVSIFEINKVVVLCVLGLHKNRVENTVTLLI